MPKYILTIRQSSALRAIAESEVVGALPASDQNIERKHIEVPTAQFADAVAQGDWGGHDLFLREAAAKIKEQASNLGDVEVHFMGIAEVSHIVALGAHIGNERLVIPHDHLGEVGAWKWPDLMQTVKLKTTGMEDLSVTVKARGSAVIRISVSGNVTDADVRAVVGDGTLSDVTISHAEVAPTRNLIRSLADVEAVRKEFIAAYGTVLNTRPGIDVVHLFLAAPPSICFAIGQELNLRNSKPVQTYRFRRSEDREPAQQAAILLSPEVEQIPIVPLTSAQLEQAAHIRKNVWRLALQDVETYAANKEMDGKADGLWYNSFVHRDALECAAPFPSLPSFAGLVPRNVQIDPDSYSGDFAFEDTGRHWWRLNDRLLVAFNNACDENDERLRQLIRLFLFHEYVHLFHGIGKHTALQVGKFANCLEHIDYTADTYALLHQMDLMRYNNPTLSQFEPMRSFLVDQIELAIRSFWAFNNSEWQVRRVRRFLNWYWRQVQIENAKSADAIMMLFQRQPRVEIGGLYQVSRGPRVLAFLNRLDATTHLELAIVMEDEKLYRLSDSPNTNLRELLESFRKGEHSLIKQFFRAVYDTARGAGSAVQPIVSAKRAK